MLTFSDGPVWLKGIRFKGSGGGTSGTVAYPAYMQDRHTSWLGSTSTPNTTVLELLNLNQLNNPFEGLYYSDPADREDEIISEFNDWKSGLATFDEVTDWGAILTAVVADVDTSGVLNDIDIATIISGVRTAVGTALDGLIADAKADVDENAGAVITAADTYGATVDAIVAAAVQTIDADQIIQDSKVGYEDFVRNFVSDALQRNNPYEVVDSVRDYYIEMIDENFVNFVESLDESIIAAAVKAFSDSRVIERTVARKNFRASQSDVGAERSSTYTLGLALMESSFERDVSAFQTDLRFRGALQEQQLKATEAGQRMQALANLMQGESSIRAQISSLYSQAYQTGMQMFTNLFQVDVRERAGMETTIKQVNAGVRTAGMSLLANLFQTDLSARMQAHIAVNQIYAEIHRAGFSLYADNFRAEAQTRLQAALADKSTRDSLLGQGVTQMLGHREFLLQMRAQLPALMAEVQRISFVMDSEYVGNTGDLNRRYAMWDWENFQSATSVLGGLGGASYMPEGPTKISSALSGALGGAAVGAMAGAKLGAAGGPAGALIGAALGGLAGAL